MKKDALFPISMLFLLVVAVVFHTMQSIDIAGFEAYKRSRYEGALKRLLPLAKKGNVEAQVLVGNMYSGVIGVKQDDTEAFKWYLSAAESGNPRAQYLLARMFKIGKRIPQDPAKAAHWFRKAAESGAVEAQWELSDLYPGASSVNRLEAGKWYNAAALEAEKHKNLSEALKYHLKAAKLGNVRSQQELGVMYLLGKGIPINFHEAAKWLLRAANSGDVRAQTRAGELYEKGLGLPKNYAEALKWYRKSAGKGFSGAQFALGMMHENGTGVPQDYPKAFALYKKAAEQNENQAHCRLAIMYEAGKGTSVDMKTALMHAFICTGLEYKHLDNNFQKNMTPEDIETAKRAVRDWKETHSR